MTIRGHSQVPGPIGLSRGGDGGRVPGPAGTFRDGGLGPEPAGTWWDDGGWAPQPIGTLWDRQSNPPASGQATKAVKTTTMPGPTKDQDSRDVHVVLLPLFNPKTNAPSFTEVQQAPGIANCPVAAMLAALAFTPDGQKLIESIVPPEISGDVVTDLSAAGTLSNPPPGHTLKSSRYFAVKLQGGSFEVSDVLYTDDHDHGWSPFYMRDPSDAGDQTIWAAIIEKALALKLKGYDNLDDDSIHAEDFWEKVTGVKPGIIEIKSDTPLSIITKAVKDSTRVPSIAASKGDPGNDIPLKGGGLLTAYHGFALLGFQGDKIRLYDPAKAKTVPISPEEFRADFKAILYRQ